MAARNRAALGLEELVELRHADLLEGIAADSLGLVVSNPPYVTSGDMNGLAPDIRLYEPVSALDGGEDGLAVFRRLLPQAARVLRPGGTVLLEVGDGQAPAVAGLAREAGFSLIEVHRDLSGKERIVAATLPGRGHGAVGRLGWPAVGRAGGGARRRCGDRDTYRYRLWHRRPLGLAGGGTASLRRQRSRLPPAVGRDLPFGRLGGVVAAGPRWSVSEGDGGAPTWSVHVRGRDLRSSAVACRHGRLVGSAGAGSSGFARVPRLPGHAPCSDKRQLERPDRSPGGDRGRALRARLLLHRPDGSGADS